MVHEEKRAGGARVPSMNMQIRSYRPEVDEDLLRRCIIELQEVERRLDPWLPKGAAMVDAYVAQLTERCCDWDGQILVAYGQSGEPLGMAAVFAQVPESEPDEPPGTFALLSDLVVLPDHRREGVGRALLAAAEGFAREHGATVVRLEVMSGNGSANQFYTRNGYRDRLIQLEKRFDSSVRRDDRLPNGVGEADELASRSSEAGSNSHRGSVVKVLDGPRPNSGGQATDRK